MCNAEPAPVPGDKKPNVAPLTRNFIQSEMAHQDSLLQNYRAFLFQLNAILLAFGSFLVLGVDTLDVSSWWRLLPILPAVIAFLVTLIFLCGPIRRRQRCVDWWQVALLVAEGKAECAPLYRWFRVRFEKDPFEETEWWGPNLGLSPKDARKALGRGSWIATRRLIAIVSLAFGMLWVGLLGLAYMRWQAAEQNAAKDAEKAALIVERNEVDKTAKKNDIVIDVGPEGKGAK